jgi:hypothetical protein
MGGLSVVSLVPELLEWVCAADGMMRDGGGLTIHKLWVYIHVG